MKVYYRSKAMSSALSMAETVAAYTSIRVCVRGPAGPERLEVATAAATAPGLELLTLNPSASDELVGSVIRRIREDTPLPPEGRVFTALLVDDAHLLQHPLQRELASLYHHTKLVITVEHDAYSSLDPRLRHVTSGHTISIPPLSDRPEDVAPLVLRQLFGLDPDYTLSGIDQMAWDVLLAYPWPDSRLLLHAVQEAVGAAQLEQAEQVSLRHLPPRVIGATPHGFLDIPFAKGWTKRQLEESYILHCIARTNKKTHAAKVLGMTKDGLYYRLPKLLGIGKQRKMVDGEFVEMPPAPMPSHPGEPWERAATPERRPDLGQPRDASGSISSTTHAEMRAHYATQLSAHQAACEAKGVPPDSRLFSSDYRTGAIEATTTTSSTEDRDE